MNLSELFAHNYQELSAVAHRIVRKKDYRRADELLSTTYLTIHEKATAGTVLVPGEHGEFVKWFSRCMKNYFKWPNSDFNTVRSNESLTIDSDIASGHRNDNQQKFLDTGYSNRYDELLTDHDAQKEIELSVEETNDFTKELIEISSSMKRERALQYIEVIEFKRTLPAHEVILFELYFEKEMSTRDIAREYSTTGHTINYQSINKMINAIKQKINNYQWKQSVS